MSTYESRSAVTGIEDIEDLKKELSALLRHIDQIPTEIIAQEAQTVMREAIAETPYKTGRLEDSVYVRVSRDKRRPGFRIGAKARDPKTGYNYAFIQHEATGWHHPIKGKAQYLYDPFRRAVDRIYAKVADRILDKFK